MHAMHEQTFGKAYGGTAPENYEKYFVPTIALPLARDLVEAASLQAGERVLDVACGTGVVARLAAERVAPSGRVAGLDVNPGMLAVARSATPPDLSIDWYETSAEAMPLPDNAFDAVLCQMGLQFVPDKLVALREMRRTLTKGGRLLLNLPGPMPPLFAALADRLARHIHSDAASFVRLVFSLDDADALRQLIEAAGFSRVAVRRTAKSLRLPPPAEFLWQYVHGTPLVGSVAKADDRQRAALERDVCARWQEFVVDGALKLDLQVATATGRS